MARRSLHRLADRPLGTATLAELRAAAAFASVPTTTLRARLAPAVVGHWVPPGRRHALVLFDVATVERIADAWREPRARRAGSRRRQRRASAPTPYGPATGWVSARDLAHLAGLDDARAALRWLAVQEREIASLARAGVLEEARQAASGRGDAVGHLRPLRREKRIVEGRQRWTFPRDDALAHIDAARRDAERRAQWTRR